MTWIDPATGQQRVFFAGEDGAFTGVIVDSGDPDAIVGSLEPGERAIVVLPFDPREASIAHRVRRTDAGPLDAPLRSRAHEVRESPSAGEYASQVDAALRRIEDGEFEKVVLGRAVELVSTPPLGVDEVLAQLLRTRPGRYVFAVPVAHGTLVGASPELLVRRRGTRMTSFPLAGSIPRAADPATDAALPAGLRRSPKDLAEHEHVVAHIRAALTPVSRELTMPDAPEPIATDTMWHLATPIAADLHEPAASALALTRLLHPTPAVGGFPTSDALSAIADLEGASRGVLTGAVGWVDADGDGEFALAIRSGVLDGPRLRLYAGAGIVAGSDPDAEARETGAKLATMLTAVGAR